MPPDLVRAADARAWLAKAAQDLRRVDLLLAAEPPDEMMDAILRRLLLEVRPL